MFENKVQSKVLLPAWMFEQAKDKEEFKKLLAQYMKTCYPNYIVKRIDRPFALCERND